MNHIVLYYSKTGSNEFLARRIADELDADIEAVRPRLNFMPDLLVSTALGFGLGARKLNSRLEDYDSVILCGPLWIGKAAFPLQSVIRRNRKAMKRVCFATCCGSTDEKKEDRFGYAGAFRHLEKLAGGRPVCEAFPIGLVIPEEKQEDSEAFMKTRLNESNFNGEMLDRFKAFIEEVRNG